MIGVLLAQLDDAYQAAVWKGIERRAVRRGVGAICFLGSRINSPIVSEATANVAFRIADPRNVDGLIVVSSTIATFLDADELSRQFASRGNIPLISAGVSVPGVPSVTVSGTMGVSTLVRHLILDHHFTRLALIGGPPGHAEAEEREAAFRAALKETGTPFNERLAMHGTFVRESGAEMARLLLKRKIPFDAVVCMNDMMALGALGVMRDAGISVPQDVAITGFDGIDEARYATPPLTTVIQPLPELGSASVDVLLDLMAGKTPRSRELSCVPVIRESCGCPPRRTYNADLVSPPPTASAKERRAITALTALVRRGDAEGFISGLSAALAASTLDGLDPGRWNDYLSVITHRSRSGRSGGLRGGQRAASALFEFARVLVGETSSRLQAARRVAAEDRLAKLRAISASLAGAFEIPEMLSRLELGLRQLGAQGGYLALFDGKNGSPDRARLLMGAPKGVPPSAIRFRTMNLLPDCVKTPWRKGSWVLEPLIFQSETLGYMLLPGGVDEPAVYDTLSDQTASALKGALLLEQVRTHERRLEAEVARRTAELTRTNVEITHEIQRRMRLEREVTEISNRTMQRIGQDLHDDLCQYLAGIAMYASVLRGGLSGSDPSAMASLDKIGNLLEDSIVRAKQIARGMYPAELEEHGLVAAVEELVESARRSYSTVIDFRASPDFILKETDRATQVYRIIQEALSNALKHSQSDRVEVRLYLDLRGALMVAEVTDYGIGLPDAVPGEGMGLRIMRYRSEMAGAELAIERLSPGTRVSCRFTQS